MVNQQSTNGLFRNMLLIESRLLKEEYEKEYAARGLSGRLEEISKKQKKIKDKIKNR